MIRKLKYRLGALILHDEGGKKVVNKKRAFIAGILIFVICLIGQLAPLLFKSNIPRASIRKSDVPLVKDKDKTIAQKSEASSNHQNIGGVLDVAPAPPKQKAVTHAPMHILYKGRQVFYPDSSNEKIPSGAKFIGKLLTGIDTRSQQSVHVILPYGGSHKSGGGSFPPDTILMGQSSYSGEGERILITFSRAVLPDGQEFAIQAQALSSKDYQLGIIGDYHSNRGNKMASALGLSMVGGISEVMVEKEGFGQGNTVAPRATIKNGLYNGLTKVTEMEANDQIAQLGQSPNYITIDSGVDLIVSLEEGVSTNERHE